MKRLRIQSACLCAGMALVFALGSFPGCGGPASAPVDDKAGHGQAVSKNMEDFMKSAPAQPKAPPRAQTK